MEDIQQILTYFDDREDWDCKPSGIDNRWGARTEKASENFLRSAMNKPPESDQVDALLRSIHTTHKWPLEVWRVVFDLYMEVLAEHLETKPGHLKGMAGRLLRFLDVDKRFVACGESFPIDDGQKTNYRSQTNRRVELLLFDKYNAPVLDCPAKANGKYPNKVHQAEDARSGQDQLLPFLHQHT